MAYDEDVEYRSFGHFHCPMCFCMREFIALDVHSADPTKAECEECGYVFGSCFDEVTQKARPVLKQATVDRARELRIKSLHASLFSGGVRREVLTGRAKRPSTNEG